MYYLYNVSNTDELAWRIRNTEPSDQWQLETTISNTDQYVTRSSCQVLDILLSLVAMEIGDGPLAAEN